MIKDDTYDKDDKHFDQSQIKEHLMRDEVKSPLSSNTQFHDYPTIIQTLLTNFLTNNL